jgi:lysozyme
VDVLIESIKRHEGYRDRVYLDSEGKLTCGWGHHLWVGSKVPIEASDAFFKQDLADAVSSFRTIPPVYRRHLNPTRARVITEMIFNMNVQRVLLFRKMWEAIENMDYDRAADEMLSSKWATQVGQRAIELAEIMRKG